MLFVLNFSTGVPYLLVFLIFIRRYDDDDDDAVVENLSQDPDRNNLHEPVIDCSSSRKCDTKAIKMCPTFHILCMDYTHMQCKAVIMMPKVQILFQIQTC